LANLFERFMRKVGSRPSDEAWFDLVCRSEHEKGLKVNGVPLPGFPDAETQVMTTGQSGCPTLREANFFYEDCLEKFKESENFLKRDKSLLDFGTGWGRILRFFLKDFQSDRLYGVDVYPELLDMCSSTFEFGTFMKSEAFPPLDLADQSIDFITGYSVFSHLSEEACLAWIKEFNRIMKPGGVLALTTRGRWFLDHCESMKGTDVEGFPRALSHMFEDFDEAREKYDNGEFVHSNAYGITGNGPLDSSFYGETFIPEKYAKRVYSDYFEVLDYDFVPGRSTHPIMFFRKH